MNKNYRKEYVKKNCFVQNAHQKSNFILEKRAQITTDEFIMLIIIIVDFYLK
jgi:hypothetical protein